MRTTRYQHLKRAALVVALILGGCGGDPEPAPTTTGLFATGAEPAGENCAAGGLRVDAGTDQNSNGALEAAEITKSVYVCNGADGTTGANGTDGANGADGSATRVEVTTVAPGADCPGGGQRVAWGTDDDGDGTLAAAEEDGARFVCDGDNGGALLVSATAEPAGATCANGGTRIDSGADADSSGTLDAGEVASTSYICAAADGIADEVSVSAEPAGATCAAGGQRVDHGRDANGDGTLDATEITSTRYICDGVDAPTTALSAAAEPVGPDCVAGGQRLSWGEDTSGDGALDAGEITGSAVVCDGEAGANGADGLQTLTRVTAEPAGGSCAAGGQRIDYGADDNGNGTLDAGEIDGTAYACDGAAGATGASGLAALTRASAEPAGANCAFGGQRLQYGLDDNGNGALDPAEADGFLLTCNGAPGTNGRPGIRAVVRAGAEPVGANCAFGGQRLQYGLDDNENGALDAAEIDGTAYVCDLL